MTLMKIQVNLPQLLTHCAEGQRQIEIGAGRIEDILPAITRAYPLLKTHLFDGDGNRRPHVLFFLNDENMDWIDDHSAEVKAGDQFTILQAVSGG